MNIYLNLMVIILIEMIICKSIPPIYFLKKNKKIYLSSLLEKIFILSNIVIMLYFVINRDLSIGTDYKNYTYMLQRLRYFDFKNLSAFSKFYNIEYVFVVIEKILQYVFLNDIYIFSIFYLLLFGMLYHHIDNYSKNKIMSIYLFLCLGFYNQSMNIMRQYLAALILLYSIKYIKKRKLFNFLIIVFLASLIHKTSILFITIYPLINFNLNIKRLSFSIVISAMAATIFSDYIIKVLAIIGNYSRYLSRDYGGEVGIGLVINFIIFFFYLTIYDKFKKADENADIWLLLMSISIAINFFSLEFSLVARIMIYTRLSVIISIPNSIYSLDKDKYMRFVFQCGIVILYALYYYLTVTNTNMYETVPYLFSM